MLSTLRLSLTQLPLLRPLPLCLLCLRLLLSLLLVPLLSQLMLGTLLKDMS